MKFTMCSVDHAICVSNTCRENLVVRATLPPENISTIPNAIDPSKFTPDPSARFPKGTINVVIMSRLVYRKGIDLVAPVVKVGRPGGSLAPRCLDSTAKYMVYFLPCVLCRNDPLSNHSARSARNPGPFNEEHLFFS